MQLLGGQQRKALGKVEPHLPSEDTQRAGARAIAALDPFGQDVGQQVQIGLLWVSTARIGGCGDGDMSVHRVIRD
jgi:hypothetical protein